MRTRKSVKYPPIRLHKHTGQAYVNLSGHRCYLGKFGSPDVDWRYKRLVTEWEENGRQLPVSPEQITVAELAAAYWRYAEDYYRTSPKELDNIRRAMRPVLAIYSRTPVGNFGPKALKMIRQRMVSRGWVRLQINRAIQRIRGIIRWGVEVELVAPDVWHRLQAVRGLAKGRSEARESEPVTPVPDAYIEAVKPFVSRQVAALIDLQLLTAARPGELVIMRAIDIDTSGPVWLYRPQEHKTAYRGRTRTIYLGPKAQAIVRPFMAGRAVDAFLFNPREAVAERAAHAETHRRPDQPPNRRKTDRQVGDRYNVVSYRRAIHRACDKGAVPRWSPHRLRHSAATFVRKHFGLEAAQLLCGHARADVTQLYAEVNHAKALEVALKIG